MADLLVKNEKDASASQRFRDMADGSWAEVVSTVESPVAAGTAGFPNGSTPLNAASGNVANAAAVATLAGAASVTTYLTGFSLTAAGATVGVVVSATVTGVLGGTLTYTFAAPAGVLVAATPLIVTFSRPIPASAVNTAIVVTLPALGVGNTNAAVVAHGFRV